MSNTRILLIEDDPKISRFIELELSCEGYEVQVRHDGMDGLIAARQSDPHLIILDRMLPEMDGLEVCRRLRQTSDVPILMLTALAEHPDRVLGLDSGANDYLTKPFNLDELLARIRVQLRHKNWDLRKKQLEIGDLSINVQSRMVRRDKTTLNLSPKEFDLLYCLMRHPNHVVPRSEIIAQVWGWDYEGDENILDVYVHTLRDKLEQNGLPRLIHTMRGVGYVLKEP